MLVVLGGLPGVGKSAIADEIARRIGAVVVSVDPIEAAIVRSGIRQSFETGQAAYSVGATVAKHQLRLGLPVIADAANYLEVGRQFWYSAAAEAGAPIHAVEIICSDEMEHRRRLESRFRALEPLRELTWEDVVHRRAETEPWSCEHLVLDSVAPIDVNAALALEVLRTE